MVSLLLFFLLAPYRAPPYRAPPTGAPLQGRSSLLPAPHPTPSEEPLPELTAEGAGLAGRAFGFGFLGFFGLISAWISAWILASGLIWLDSALG